MSAAGSITLEGRSMTFAAASAPEHGRPLDEPALIEEELEHTGIDFTRFRQVHLRYLPYVLVTLTAYSSYGQALSDARWFRRRRHRLATFSWDLADQSLRYNDVKILRPPVLRPVRGYVTGGGTSITGVATLVFGRWFLQHTESSTKNSTFAT